MSKAFTRENDAAPDDDEDDVRLPELPAGGKNYITAAGFARLRGELMELIDTERPEIDRRIRFLTKRLEIAEVTDPSVHFGTDQVFFGATVTYVDNAGIERTVTILGIDEVDTSRGEISWVAPVARTLLKTRVGDVVPLVTPAGLDEIEVLEVRYPKPANAGPSDPLHP